MRHLFLATIAFISIVQPLFSQNQTTLPLYSHKVIIDSFIQTKAYTYLKVKERIKEKDSLFWLALPIVKVQIGETYYFDNGLQMGLFTSKELNRTFKQIIFLGYLGTTPEISEKNIIPVPVFDTIPENTPIPVVHKVVVMEVIQTTGYTYLRVNEDDKETWLAIVKIPAMVGETYTYDDASEMKNFTSKELNRTFPNILFIAKLTFDPNSPFDPNTKKKKAKKPEKKIVTTIEKVYKNKQSYSGKTLLIKGKVTKVSPNILGKTWIHLEDGTGFSGKHDLTITTTQEVKIDDNITVQGKISLDKDFGSGYFFEVIMEDGEIQKQ